MYIVYYSDADFRSTGRSASGMLMVDISNIVTTYYLYLSPAVEAGDLTNCLFHLCDVQLLSATVTQK